MDHQVASAAAAPDGDEVALHSRAHETNQSIRSSGQFGQVCDVVVVPAILGASSDGRQKRPRNRPSNGGGFSGGTTGTAIQSLTCLRREGWREKNKSVTDRKWGKESEAATEEGGIS